MRYREHIPEPRLQRWVECLWVSECERADLEHPVRPDGCLDVVYAPDSGLRIVGAMTVEQRFSLRAGARAFGIRFHPGMAGGFLKLDAAEITDRTIALEDVWGGNAREIERRIEEAKSLDVASRVLSGALATPVAAPDFVRRAIEAITMAHGDIDLEWVARQSGLSIRQFRRRCLEASGLTPKHLCRVLRFRRACALAAAGVDWAGIAASAGYFDQSHLIRDFREFTGTTPVSVFSNTEAGTAG